MNRSKFLAVLALVTVAGGLVATQFGSADPTDRADQAASVGGSQAESGAVNDPGAGDPAVGGEATNAETGSETLEVIEPPPVLDPKPALTDLDGWLQTDATGLEDFAGQVRIVEFWTFGCFNCKNRLPHTQALYEEYHPRGLEIIGIHSPEFDFERDPDRIAQAAVDLGVVWPIALDTDKTNFRAWQGNRRFWPRVYVLDQNGDVRYDHIGEGDYDGLEEVVAYLIENGP